MMSGSNDTSVVLRLPQELKERLQQQAELLDVSLSEVIRMKLLIAENAVHREPVVRLGERRYRLQDILRPDVLDYEVVRSDDTPSSAVLVDEPGSNRSGLAGRYSDVVQRAIVCAREEALRFESSEIARVHLALGLLKVDEANARRIVSFLAPAVDDMVAELESLDAGSIERRRSRRGADVSLTRAAEKTLKLVYVEAKHLGREVADSAIVLLALLRERDATTEVFERRGITYDRVRAALVA